MNRRSSKSVYGRLLKKHVRRSRKRLVRYSLLTANLALLITVIGFISSNPSSGEATRQNALSAQEDNAVAANPLDQLSSADIAVHVARMTRLEEAVAVVNHADSVNAQLAVTPTDESVVVKPQIVSTELKSKKDIVIYNAKAGDTIDSLAIKFGVTSDSIRWSNDMATGNIEPGQELVIPPVSGIVYTVKSGDTIDSLSSRYSADKQQLIQINDAEISGLKVGERIIIPDGILPASRSYQPRSYSSGFAFGGITPVYGGNGYDYGWCTWHVANRRQQIGRPLPTNLGNAVSWYRLSQQSGLSTGGQPRAGAVVWHANLGGLGHVGFVEKVNSDGSILVSDMNYPIWGSVTYRTISPGEFGSYRFIY